MFVNTLRAQGAVVSTLALLALAGCDDPVAETDLRPEGPPDVLSVLAMNDPGAFFETATFCKQGDVKRPGLVAAGLSFENIQICDEDLANPAGFIDPETMEFVPAIVEDNQPTFWYMRVMFDELLNPDIEELIEIFDPTTNESTGIFNGSLANTQPVTLNCNGAPVEYDGYYSPSGNNITWPLGPSLVIQPTDFTVIASGSSCTLELKENIVDKDGNTVPSDQRGTFDFGIAGLEFVESSPEPADAGDEAEIVTDSAVVLTFNGFINPAEVTAAEVILKEGAAADLDCTSVTANGTAVPASIVANADGDPVSVDVTKAAGDFIADRMYSLTFTADNEVKDLAGGTGALPAAADFTLCFVAQAPL